MNHHRVANNKECYKKTYELYKNNLGLSSNITHDIIVNPKNYLRRAIDFLELNISNSNNKFDITYVKAGPLNYFYDLNTLSKEYIPCWILMNISYTLLP